MEVIDALAASDNAFAESFNANVLDPASLGEIRGI
jgi:hypothetical protein